MVIAMKKGWRFLVFAEAFSRKKLDKKSIIVGAIINGISFLEEFRATLIDLYGLDSTEKIIEIYNALEREDVNFIILSGVIIALYNIIDLHKVYEEIRKPLIAISYRESEKNLERILKSLPDGESRLEIYKKNKERIKIRLCNGYSLFIRPIGLTVIEAKRILDKITIHGRIPEPVKIVKSLARGLLNSMSSLCEACGDLNE